MVTQAYIETIRESARFWQVYDAAADRLALTAYLQAGMPDWDAAPDDLLSRGIPFMVEYNRLGSEVAHQQIRRALLPYAEGDELDVLGVGPPAVLRFPGEADDPYRLRIANSHQGLNIGSLPAVQQFAREGVADIADVIAVMAPNRQDMSVWALKAALTQLSAAENAALLEYLRHENRVIGGVQISAPAPTVVAYTIRVSVRYDAMRENTQQLQAAVRAAIYAWLDANRRLGMPVHRSAITRAAKIDGVTDLVVLEPSYDLAPPELVISGGDPSIPARATIRVAAATGAVSVLDILDRGEDYQSAPTVGLLANSGIEGTGAAFSATIFTAGNNLGQLEDITIDNGGSDYLPGAQHDYCPVYNCPSDETNVVVDMVGI